jgi:NAD(P)-dependent dehydrogenase (short-subunit alcohol dehydrogenase family)
MSGRLAEKVAIVTGAGQGIGEGIARRFAEEGAIVVVTDLDGESAERVAAACGGDSWGAALDVTDTPAVDAAVAQICERHGRLDVVANNAGVTVVGGPTEVEEHAWDLAFDVNVKGMWRVIKAAWPRMIEQGGGSIVNQSSCAALGGMPRNLGYCATKGAVMLMSQSAALDGGEHGIRVNCVCPGFVETPMCEAFFEEQLDPQGARADTAAAHPIGRMGRPSDVGNAFVYLASDEASWVTGSVIAIDGGLTASI